MPQISFLLLKYESGGSSGSNCGCNSINVIATSRIGYAVTWFIVVWVRSLVRYACLMFGLLPFFIFGGSHNS